MHTFLLWAKKFLLGPFLLFAPYCLCTFFQDADTGSITTPVNFVVLFISLLITNSMMPQDIRGKLHKANVVVAWLLGLSLLLVICSLILAIPGSILEIR